MKSQAATRYSDFTFAKDGSLSDGTNTFTAVAQDGLGRGDTNTISVYPPATVAFTYDSNGNLTSDGRRGFDYDDENQLTRVTVTNAWKSEFVYDGRLRRRVRKEFVWQNSAWAQTAEVRYVYDGMLVAQERDGNNLPRVAYMRGLDLASSLEGAGGIGGLLARTDQQSVMPQHAYYHADGNGNVTALVNDKQILVAKYLYEPFGNLIAKSGPLCDANLYRFSSKEFHESSAFYYYGYRFYDPNLQRWLNRDPIGEVGGLNLYGFVHNNPPNSIDLTGEAATIGIGAGIGTAVCPGIGTGVGAAVGAIATGIGIAIIACTSHSPPPKCGDCTPAEHAALQAAVVAACKSGPSKCTANQDLATLQVNLAKNAACAAARDAIDKKCFKGGDAGHREAAENARRAAAKCAAFVAQKQANQPQNPNPQPPNPQPPQP